MSRFGFTFLYPLHNPLLFSIWTFVLFYNAGMFSDISLSCLSLLCLFFPCGVTDRNVLGRHGLSSSRLFSSLCCIVHIFLKSIFQHLALSEELVVFNLLFNLSIELQFSVTILFTYGSSMCLFFHSVLFLGFQFLPLCQQSLDTFIVSLYVAII